MGKKKKSNKWKTVAEIVDTNSAFSDISLHIHHPSMPSSRQIVRENGETRTDFILSMETYCNYKDYKYDKWYMVDRWIKTKGIEKVY